MTRKSPQARCAAAALLLLATLAAPACATLSFPTDEGRLPAIPRRTVLQSFGSASTTISLLSTVSGATPEVDDSPFYTVGSAVLTEAANGYTNYTIPFSFDGGVGVAPYKITIGDEDIEGEFVIAGFSIMVDGTPVSGDDGAGVTVGQKGEFEFDVVAIGADGEDADLSDVSITAREMTGTYFEEVDLRNTGFNGASTKFTLAISPYRVGTGAFIVSFEDPSISVAGESFETVLNVRQETSPEPPCVVIADDITTTGGSVSLRMYNILSPPLSSPVSSIVLSIGSSSYDFDEGASSLVAPTSTVVFPGVSSSGSASVTCDGEDAVILPGNGVSEITVTTPAVPEELAVDTLPTDLPSSDEMSLLTVVIRVVNSDPTTLTRSQAQAIVDEVCRVTDASQCDVNTITRGSAIISMGALVEEEEGKVEELQDRFDDCTVQSATGYACEGELELVGAEVTPPRAVASSAVAAGGLATWTIVLIACVGAFALVLVVVLGLWAVYRRSSEQSESEYSSSGPLGVPDPSDLLYEQSIVRDIYGRGDFPEGGPSAEVAEQRAREADLREEFPRPPSSSSGLSRGHGTDDASSTYSV